MENASFFDENSNLNLQSSAPSSLTLTQRKNTNHLHVDVLQEYAPLQKHRRESFLSQQEKELRRTNKEHHLDLWTDGSIYPKDPTTNAPPPFANITNLLHFMDDGKDGRLRYTKHLKMRELNAERQINFLAMENMQLKKLNEACSQKILSNKETIQGLKKKITSLQEKVTMLGSRKRKQDLCNIENMKIDSGGMKKQIRALRRTREEAERAEEFKQARLNAITQRYNQTQEEIQNMQDALNQYFGDAAEVEEWAAGERQRQEQMEASQVQEAWEAMEEAHDFE
ncbi:hypothetical protein L7F22_014475 [Adiantum nelumboides]|nr:hypothetical protein [Adiantum nelumboides]